MQQAPALIRGLLEQLPFGRGSGEKSPTPGGRARLRVAVRAAVCQNAVAGTGPREGRPFSQKDAFFFFWLPSCRRAA